MFIFENNFCFVSFCVLASDIFFLFAENVCDMGKKIIAFFWVYRTERARPGFR